MHKLSALLALSMVASAALAQSPTLDRIRKTGSITLGYVDGAIPFSYIREAKPEGYSVELCERIAGELRRSLKLAKLETRWKALTIQNRLEAVRKGEVDLECSTTSRTLGRQELVDFSLMTFVDGASVLVRANDRLRVLGDFGGRKIAVISGTTTERAIGKTLEQLRVDAQIVPVKTRAEGLEAVDQGKADGLASDRVALFGVALTSANPAAYRILDDIYSVEPYALALRRGDADFRLAVDRALAGLYREGGIGEIYGKWFGRLGQPSRILEALYLLEGISE